MMNSEHLRQTPSYDAIRMAALKTQCEDDHLFFSRYFFKARQGIKFRVNWHHHLISLALQRVLDGHCTNLVINVPPGSSKTEMAIINFMARGLAINPNCRFLHISSGDDLVLLNSQTVRDVVSSDEFQQFWPMEIASDAKAKKRWNVMVPTKRGGFRKAGGVYAVALGGQITGFRAGHMEEGFNGAILIDDPLKADAAYSESDVKKANRRLVGTVKSRKANPKTPIIVIMQRLGMKDPTGFIKGGNLPGKWEYVTIPALIDDEYVAKLDPEIQAILREQTKDSPRDDKGRFSYWEYKEPLQELLELEAGRGQDADGNAISKFTFASQYQQEPRAMGGNIIKGADFPRVALLPRMLYRKIYADTAMKTEERHDYSVFECWGYGEDKKIYLLDMIRGKWEAPDLKTNAIEFWHKQAAIGGMGTLREMVVEDKASGTGLIQDIKRNSRIPIRGVERVKDKYTRVMDVVAYIARGDVCLLEGAPFNSAFIEECEAFTADDSHAFDDQIDPMCDAIVDMISARPRGFFS